MGGPQTACVGSSATAPSFCSSRVFVAAADGSTGAVQVGDPDLSARAAAWSPDGETIAFSSGDAQKGIGLYLMKADGTDVRRLGEVSGTWWSFLRLAWSPDGKSIAAGAGMETQDIWVFASDGSAEKMVSEAPEVPTDQGMPAYAPDGALAWGAGCSRWAARRRRWQTSATRSGRPTVCTSWGLRYVPARSRDHDATGDRATIEDASDPLSWQRLPG